MILGYIEKIINEWDTVFKLDLITEDNVYYISADEFLMFDRNMKLICEGYGAEESYIEDILKDNNLYEGENSKLIKEECKNFEE